MAIYSVCSIRGEGIGAHVQQYDAAVARCKAVASDYRHTLSKWYPVNERLHASPCEECGARVWVTRSGQDEGWRVGGRALSQDCPE